MSSCCRLPKTQTRYPRTHGLALRETSRDPSPPFTAAHAVASHLSLPETTSRRFSLSLQQGRRKSQVCDGPRLPPNLNLEPLDV